MSACNADMRKANTHASKQESEIATVKGRLMSAKQEIKSIKSSAMDEKKLLKSNYEVSISSLKSDKNNLSSQVRKLEVKGRGGEVAATDQNESIEVFA